MSNLTTLPKGDSAWLLRKAIQQVIEQVNTLEANVNPAATGGSLNTQVLFNDNGAVKGDTNLTFNKTTDTLTTINGQFTDLNASGNVAVGNLTVSGTFTALGGENASAVRAAASDYAAVAFDGATASTRIASTLTGQAIGTGDFSIWCRFKISQATAKAVFSVVEDANNYFGLTTSSGTYGLDKTIGGVASNAAITGFTGAAFAGQIVDFVLVRSAGVFSVYVNGSAYTLTNTTGNISLSAVANLRVGGYFTASQVFDKRVYRSVVFNRALSASDVTELITVGVNPADQWGTQTQIANTTTLNGGFETAGGGGADAFANWVEFTTGTTTITRDTTVFSPNLSSTASANFTTDASNSTANITLANTLLASKRFRLSFDFRHNGTAAAGPQYNFGAGSDIVGTATAPNTWTSYVIEAIASGTTFAFSRSSGAGATKTSWYDNVILERIGAIVDLDFTVGIGFQATDRSTNNLHGTLFNGVEFTQPRRMAVLYATTTASGNTQILGSLAIPTNAIIEDVIVNSTGSATVSVGNVSAGTQIVNAASVVSGRQKLTIATPFSTTGNLWVNSSAAVTLQFTILYTIAA